MPARPTRARGSPRPAWPRSSTLVRRDVAPVVSLYVNDCNVAARRAYERVGFRQTATLRHGHVLSGASVRWCRRAHAREDVLDAPRRQCFAASGVVHLVRPEVYEPLMPDWVPAHREIVLASGVAELRAPRAWRSRAPGTPRAGRARPCSSVCSRATSRWPSTRSTRDNTALQVGVGGAAAAAVPDDLGRAQGRPGRVSRR